MNSAWFGEVGGTDALPDSKPAIRLIMTPTTPRDYARHVGAGCEEEGVPLAWEFRDGSVPDLARNASLASHLEVGIGMDCGECAIALVKVPRGPYIRGEASDAKSLRWIGQSAARMAKGEPIPFEDDNKAMELEGRV